MPINQYEQSFEYLVSNEIPRYMHELKTFIDKPISMEQFAIEGQGISKLCSLLGLDSDFPGCYVLIEDKKPIYVGISKNVLRRLRQHVRGTTHFDASLAYRIAADNMPHTHTRSKAMEQKEFKTEFDTAKEYLRSLNVVFVKIQNPLALYVFEPYCAMHFDTCKWNTFETH